MQLPREELESNYRHLARSYLELQRIHLSLSRCHVEQVSNNEVDLPVRYQDALKRIDELEKLVSTSNALGADAEWAQEKMKIASLAKSLQEKVDFLNASREKLQLELQEAKELNELMEFQILEHQQQSYCEVDSRRKIYISLIGLHFCSCRVRLQTVLRQNAPLFATGQFVHRKMKVSIRWMVQQMIVLSTMSTKLVCD